MSRYSDQCVHDLIDAAVRHWWEEHLTYVGEPFWEFSNEGFIDIFYHWLGQSECIHVPVENIKKNIPLD